MPEPMKFATVDLDREELAALVMYAQQQAAEHERMLDRFAEQLGDPAATLGVRKGVEKRAELFQVLAMKLEQAAKEAGWKR